MRISLIIVLLVDCLAVSGQSFLDSVFYLRKIDSLENSHYKVKDTLRKLQYEYQLFISDRKIDTCRSNDSVIINYRSKSGTLLKRKVNRGIQDDGEYQKIEVFYFNEISSVEFEESWELARSYSESNELLFTWYIYSFKRYKYDSANLLAEVLIFYPAFSRTRFRRVKYSYNDNGKPVLSESRESLKYFWE